MALLGLFSEYVGFPPSDIVTPKICIHSYNTQLTAIRSYSYTKTASPTTTQRTVTSCLLLLQHCFEVMTDMVEGLFFDVSIRI